MKVWKCQRCGHRLKSEFGGQKYFCPQCRAVFSIEFLRDKEKAIQQKISVSKIEDLIDQSINRGIYDHLCEIERDIGRFEELFDVIQFNEQEFKK